MKPPALILAAFVIAALSGTGGFILGKHRSGPTTAKPTGIPPNAATPLRQRHGSGITTTNLTQLRADLDRNPDPLARFNSALQHLEEWVNTDPTDALDWLSSQQPSARRNDVIRMALSQFTENDPRGAAEWCIDNLTGIELNNSLILIAEEWARRDGLEAAHWLTALPPTRERNGAMENLLFTWAGEDPAAAIKYIGTSPATGDLAATLRYATFAGWAKSDPQSAVPASLASSRKHQDPGQFANTLANWATVDLPRSSQWLLTHVAEPDERAPAVLELATLFAHQSPDSGLAWIRKLSAGPEQEEARNRLAAEWSATDPTAVADWAASQEPGTLTDESALEIFRNYLLKDPAAFQSWRDQLPEGPLKTQAFQVGNPGPEGP